MSIKLDYPALPVGSRYDEAERKGVSEVFDNGVLWYLNGRKCHEFTAKACEYYSCGYCVGGSSGSAVIHAAIAALELPPGSEVITSPITDMGTLIGILYQNLIPVFADITFPDCNISSETIEPCITSRTRAIVPVHLAGHPCDMAPIMALAKKHNLYVVEDCAQANGTTYRSQPVGTIGDIGCFSLNESKHLSSGEGGYALTNNEKLYRNLHNYMDKYYDRLQCGNRLAALAPNYRMTEMQYAVAIAQLDKLAPIVRRRRAAGCYLSQALGNLPGITVPQELPESASSWWFYMFTYDGDRERLSRILTENKIKHSVGYIEPAWKWPLFRNKSFFPGGIWPAEIVAGKVYDYSQTACPNAEKFMNSAMRLVINQYTPDKKLEQIAEVITNNV